MRHNTLKWCVENVSTLRQTEEVSIFQFVFNTCFPYLLSAITIYMNVLAGNKRPHAWAVGLVGQVGWSSWIIASQSWGFLPMNLVLWAIYAKNHIQWMREHKQGENDCGN